MYLDGMCVNVSYLVFWNISCYVSFTYLYISIGIYMYIQQKFLGHYICSMSCNGMQA